MSLSFSTLWGSLSHSCIRTKGSRPFRLSLCQGLGRDSRSDTEPCVRPRMLSPNSRCPGDRGRDNCHPGRGALRRDKKWERQRGEPRMSPLTQTRQEPTPSVDLEGTFQQNRRRSWGEGRHGADQTATNKIAFMLQIFFTPRRCLKLFVYFICIINITLLE